MKDPYSNLQRVELDDLSNIKCDTFLGEVKKASGKSVLVIRFRGEYRPGSAGEPDARFIFAKLHAAYEAWETWGIIIDMSGLKYEWGDDIDGFTAFRPLIWHDEEYPFALIVGPESEVGLATLYYGDLDKKSFSEPWVFRDLSECWEYIENESGKI